MVLVRWRFKIHVDLGAVKNISRVYFIPGHKNKVPTKYKYFCSSDGINFGSLPGDTFPPALCRFLKMEITDTSAHDEPQITELEVVEAGFEGIDFDLARKIEENPFEFITSQNDLNILENYFLYNKLKTKICFETDKYLKLEDNCQALEIQVGRGEDYEVIIPQGGTQLKNIKIMTPPLINAQMLNKVMRPLTFQELLERNYIIEYSQN